MIPGAPWHHCKRISPRAFSKRSRSSGGQFARPSSTNAARSRIDGRTAHERRPTRRVEQRRERLDVSDETVHGAEIARSRARGAAASTARRNRGVARTASALSSQASRHRGSCVQSSMSRAATSVSGSAPHDLVGLVRRCSPGRAGGASSARSRLGASAETPRGGCPTRPSGAPTRAARAGPSSSRGRASHRVPLERARARSRRDSSRVSAWPRSRRSSSAHRTPAAPQYSVLQRARRMPAIPVVPPATGASARETRRPCRRRSRGCRHGSDPRPRARR